MVFIPFYTLANCIERYTDSLLFEFILNEFSNVKPQFPSLCSYAKCTSVTDFLVSLNALLDASENERYLILENA
jgi:hypothetical protein